MKFSEIRFNSLRSDELQTHHPHFEPFALSEAMPLALLQSRATFF